LLLTNNKITNTGRNVGNPRTMPPDGSYISVSSTDCAAAAATSGNAMAVAAAGEAATAGAAARARDHAFVAAIKAAAMEESARKLGSINATRMPSTDCTSNSLAVPESRPDATHRVYRHAWHSQRPPWLTVSNVRVRCIERELLHREPKPNPNR